MNKKYFRKYDVPPWLALFFSIQNHESREKIWRPSGVCIVNFEHISSIFMFESILVNLLVFNFTK